MDCYFYILFSPICDKYYVGHTCDTLAGLLRKHNSNHKGFTGRARDWEVIYSEAYSTKHEAYDRERTVKRWKSRVRIERLISGA